MNFIQLISTEEPLDLGVRSFATSPENAFSIIVATILVNVLSSNPGLNYSLLDFTMVFLTLYAAILVGYSFKARKLSTLDQHRFERHVFHAGLWIGISLSTMWYAFLYPFLNSSLQTYYQIFASQGGIFQEFRRLVPAIGVLLPMLLLFICRTQIRVRINMIAEFKMILTDHAVEIVIASVATFPFLTAASSLWTSIVNPFVLCVILLFVLLWGVVTR